MNIKAEPSHAKTIQNMPLPVNRDNLNWEHIRRLSPEEAAAMLADVRESRMRLSALTGHLRDCEETCILRSLLAMAENDLLKVIRDRSIGMGRRSGRPRKKVRA